MKKSIIILSLAVLACACGQEINTVKVADDYGYIALKLANDNAMEQVKAEQTVTDLSAWNVSVSGSELESPVTCKASELAARAFKAGDYTVSVNNYATDADATAAKNGWGDARYEGSSEVTVEKGTAKEVAVACGKAKNARFNVVFNESFTELSKDSYTVAIEGRSITFSSTTSENLAYAAAGSTISYTLSYKYGGVDKTYDGSFTMGAAATQKTLAVTANDNGTITLAITYDDTFETVEGETVTIDAATGLVIE